ncbi:aldehyde dehydrogenase family protein, partial [Aegicerativicinus sediminis]
IVMKNAAKHLTSVTLELGGKSPVFIDGSVKVSEISEKITFGKFLNTGQTCIAPDYVLVEQNIVGSLIAEMKNTIASFYGKEQKDSKSYGRIISAEHFNRLMDLVADARSKGAEVIQLSPPESENKFFPPTLIVNPSDDMRVMREEIFGPILPIKVYTQLDEAIAYVNANERPLALYIFSESKVNIRHIIANTRAGGTTINHNLLHFLNNELPFGGINNSGIGKSHGYHGFKAFSNERAILNQFTISPVSLIKPPYTKLKQKLIDLMIKYF